MLIAHRFGPQCLYKQLMLYQDQQLNKSSWLNVYVYSFIAEFVGNTIEHFYDTTYNFNTGILEKSPPSK